MSDYYDRKGRPMTFDQWVDSYMQSFETRKRVSETTLPNGRWVSTVWLGLNHQYGNGPPLIFETMVFEKNGGDSLDQDRYSTEEEAVAGHQHMCDRWTVEVPA